MDPLMERQTRAIEEIANELMAFRESMQKLGPALERIADPPEVEAAVTEGQERLRGANGPDFALRQVSEELRKVNALLGGVYPDHPYNASWLVAKLIRERDRLRDELEQIALALTEHAGIKIEKPESDVCIAGIRRLVDDRDRWQKRPNDALSELINETGRDWKDPWPGEEPSE